MSDRAAPVRLAASLDGAAGAPVLVLGNSLGTTSELWQPQVGALGAKFRLLRYEHRGHGGSPAGCCEAIAAMDLRPMLGSVTARTLVIAGPTTRPRRPGTARSSPRRSPAPGCG